ncbi:glycosyltransferase family 4 protein [Devosia sp. MC521]|uniref:glycosyltransferase family 4 protein n=1 Tax=Devosia sp. MC521 TaxID=2759954 RepID=UPI0015FA9E26|nr:glycosyltransferase family 4 protein [Devosia sp. MC521]MBJ6989014.1 glycosyltransferase family 4 protein [Devosia sp. MC521]QMW62972.1 glycosyltransferase family 4 protein [Devosia sp. MC521]
MNGGTTFLTRICRRMHTLGKRPAVLVMFDDMDQELHEELKKHATVFYLWKYVPSFGKVLPSRLQTFGPIKWRKLLADLDQYSEHVHVMGVFGLMFAYRLFGKVVRTPTLSVGVYHQNEFLYDSKGRLFPREAQRIFRDVPSRNIVFFNESTKENYERFFSKDYSEAAVVPIGIDIQNHTPSARRKPFRIVSVGNLVDFKTYNEHVIRIVASLRVQFPDISYHIYGTGQTHDRLESLIRELDVSKQVQIKGLIPYAEFNDVVGEASVFVGSGTALLEAASLGIPALIGIESIAQPQTYGFLCDVPGLSYNEYIDEYNKLEMQMCIAQVLSDFNLANEIGNKCKAKAKRFSIDETVSGIMRLSGRDFIPPRIKSMKLWLLAFFLIETAILEKTQKEPSFGDRRNQSFSAHSQR